MLQLELGHDREETIADLAYVSFKIQNAWRRLDSELSEPVIELGRRDKPSIISSPSRLAIAHDVGNQSQRDEKRNEKTRSCGGVERAS